MEEEITREVAEETPQEEVEAVEETGEEVEVTPTAEDDETDEETGTVPVKAVVEERRKRQALEKEVEELKKSQPPPQPQPPAQKTVYDYYDEDPQSVMQWINGEIAKLTEEDPFGNVAKIELLRDQKADLRQYGISKASELSTSFRQEIQKAVPKMDAVTEYAVKELGYSSDEMKFLTAPAQNKAEADFKLKTLKTIQRAYDKENAGKGIDKKEVKRQPTQVERPGSGVSTPSPKLQKLLDEAKRTGNWMAYIEAAGI